jgi:molecular chaperone DnaJ
LADHYEVLGVTKDATVDAIKKAYRKLARELHPDVNSAPEAQERFKAVTHAYEVLSDSESRRNYDMGGQQGFGGQQFNGFGDIFDSFFGGGAGRGPRSRTERGEDALLRVPLTLEEVTFGAAKSVEIDTAVLCETCGGSCCQPGTDLQTCDICRGSGSIQRQVRTLMGNMVTTAPCGSCRGYGQTVPFPCVSCRGQGRVRARRSIEFNVPAGVEDGLRMQLRGQGEVGQGGGPNGDLHIDFTVSPHEVFGRSGDDLTCTLQVPMHDAALGAHSKIETFDGELDVAIDPGAQSGDVVTIRHKGVNHLRGSGRGDLKVTIEVQTPTKLDKEQKELFKKLAGLRSEENIKLVKQTSGFFGRNRKA